MKGKLLKFWVANKSLLMFLTLMLIFRSAVADWNHVPSGSMKPTILIGDRILVNKVAYDLRIPFTHYSIIKRADPMHGDIVVFDSKRSNKRLVKRVIGLPGDTVAMQHNKLYINGQPLSYSKVGVTDKIEHLIDSRYLIRTQQKGSRLSSFNAIEVPKGHYLVLGDNRDNSADSRVFGFVPRREIVGKSIKVVMSFNYDNYYIPRANRFFHPL